MIDPGLMDMIMRLRSRGISDNHVLRAIETVPRKYFVSDNLWDKAYEDQALPIACGQTLSPTMSIAMMTQALNIHEGHKLLEIGTGSGYHASILSKMVTRVYSIERYHKLLAKAEDRFAKLDIVNIVTRHGDGRYGWKGQAPFDRIILTCGVKSVPKKLKDQLAPGGVMVAIVGGMLVRMTKAKTKISEETILPLSIPMIETGKSKIL